MKHGFDCFSSVAPGQEGQLSSLGYTFFARYYRRAPLEGGRGNALSRAEAKRLFDLNFWALAIYQNSSDKPSYFTPENARADAYAAVAAAQHHGQTPDTTIYFSVDCNPTSAELHPIIDYFLIVKDVLWRAGYRVGVYGSGLTCKTLSDEGVAHRTWLANAKGWSLYQAWYPHADVIQTTLPFTLPFGLQIDADVCHDLLHAGLWRPAVLTTPQNPTAEQRDLISRVSAAISRIFGHGGGK